MITAGEEYPTSIMPESHWEALLSGCEILVDEGFMDLDILKDRLPSRYEHLYDEAFLRRFHLCLVMVHYKLKSPRWYRLACVGEELALDAAIDQAKSVLETNEDGPPIDEEAFRNFEQLAFKDLDFEWLFKQEMDGIESDPDLANQMRIVHLHPTEWFLPFDQNEPVHPFIAGRYESRRRRHTPWGSDSSAAEGWDFCRFSLTGLEAVGHEE